jgi:hypothetical protein
METDDSMVVIDVVSRAVGLITTNVVLGLLGTNQMEGFHKNQFRKWYFTSGRDVKGIFGYENYEFLRAMYDYVHMTSDTSTCTALCPRPISVSLTCLLSDPNMHKGSPSERVIP